MMDYSGRADLKLARKTRLVGLVWCCEKVHVVNMRLFWVHSGGVKSNDHRLKSFISGSFRTKKGVLFR